MTYFWTIRVFDGIDKGKNWTYQIKALCVHTAVSRAVHGSGLKNGVIQFERVMKVEKCKCGHKKEEHSDWSGNCLGWSEKINNICDCDEYVEV